MTPAGRLSAGSGAGGRRWTRGVSRRFAAGARVCAVVLAGLGAARGAPYVIVPNGNKVEGVSVKANENGEILLETATGVMTFPKGTTVVVDQPAAYAEGRRLLEQKRCDEAIKVLEPMLAEYRFLGWDLKAKPLLAQAYVGSQAYDKAVALFEGLAAESPGVLEAEGLQSRYQESLIGAGQGDKVRPLLDETIARGSRADAARAQLMRGKLRRAAGDAEGATLDFIRTAELFREQKDVQAEANFLAAECLGETGDGRAAEFYDVVVRQYPDSPFAAQARAKAR